MADQNPQDAYHQKHQNWPHRSCPASLPSTARGVGCSVALAAAWSPIPESQVRCLQPYNLEATDKLHSHALSGKGITYILFQDVTV